MEWKDEIGLDCDNVVAETEKALLCDIDNTEYWIPKNCISDNSEVYQKGDSGTLVISYSFARKLKLI